MREIAAVTVLYGPDADVFNSVASYATQVGKCFLVDNSPEPLSDATFGRLDSGWFAYEHLGTNVGSAAGLNYGIRAAQREGYRFALLMDQDSGCRPDMVKELLEVYLTQEPNRPPVALVCPVYCNDPTSVPGEKGGQVDVELCITSGSLIDVKIWQSLSGFDEQLFVDYVDHDYCLKVRASGCRIVRCGSAHLDHHTGKLRQIGLGRFGRAISVHNPERLFYMTRNGFVLRARYGRQFPEIHSLVRRRIAAQALKSLMFGPERRRRLSFMIHGYLAYRAAGPVTPHSAAVYSSDPGRA